jgi:hypothetical protein
LAEKVPDTEDVKELRDPPVMPTLGLTLANESDKPRARPKLLITADEKVTLSGGCPTLNVNEGPAPRIESKNVPTDER